MNNRIRLSLLLAPVCLLTAWAMAGLVGSSLASFLRQSTGSYTAMTKVFMAIFAVAFVVSVAMKIFVNRELAKKHLGYKEVETDAMGVAAAEEEAA